MHPLLLALDISKFVGWALMRRHEAPLFGTLNLERCATLDERLGRYQQWLQQMVLKHRVDGIAIESAILMPWDRVDQLLLLYGLAGITRSLAYNAGLPLKEVSVGDVKAVMGAPRFPKGTKKSVIKQAMVTAAYGMGWEVLDHHQADAGGVGLCAYSQLWPHPVFGTGQN
jgi:Holliday junction resolvasome RuvABC endonuclease subunit